MQKIGNDKLYLGIIIVLVIALLAVFLQLQRSTPSEVQGVKEIYKIILEKEPEIMGVKEENGLYKVTVRLTSASGQSAVQDVFLTKDGIMFTDRPLVKVSDYIDTLNKQKNFSACMTSNKVVLLGQNDNLAVFQQLLGLFAGRNYMDCTASQQNLEQCQQLGRQAGLQAIPAPAVLFNNTIYQGFRDVNFISSLTGCTM